MAAPDFVAIGHVTLDRFGGAVRPGGAALYAAVAAHASGFPPASSPATAMTFRWS